MTRTINMFGSISRMFGLNVHSSDGDFTIDDKGITNAAKETLLSGFGEIMMHVFTSTAVLVPFILLFRGSFNRSELDGYVDKMTNELHNEVKKREGEIRVVIDNLVRLR